MHVFVTGATGVVGRATIRSLLAEGHHVSAPGAAGRADAVRALGAKPVEVDLYDAKGLRNALVDVDATMHLATRIPPFSSMGSASSWVENNRLRKEATKLLVDASLASDVRTFIVHGITFVYAEGGDAWIDETATLDVPPGHEAMIVAEAEVTRFSEAGRRGVILRNGLFYGPECASVREALVWGKRGISTMLGPKNAYLASLHIDDCARATVAALSVPAGIYNVCDDAPVTRGDYVAGFARAFGISRPWVVWPGLVRLVGGRDAAPMLRSHRVRCAKLKDASTWSPNYPSVIEGWPAVAEVMRA